MHDLYLENSVLLEHVNHLMPIAVDLKVVHEALVSRVPMAIN